MYQGRLVELSPLEPDAAMRSLEWLNDADVAARLGRAVPVTTAEHARWYERVIHDRSHVFFAIRERDSGTHVGNVWLWGMHARNLNAELRIVIGSAPHRSRGYGSEAVALLLQVAFLEMNLHKVFLYVIADNEPAQRAFARNGFQVEGRLRDEFFVRGEYRDVLRMGILRAEFKPCAE